MGTLPIKRVLDPATNNGDFLELDDSECVFINPDDSIVEAVGMDGLGLLTTLASFLQCGSQRLMQPDGEKPLTREDAIEECAGVDDEEATRRLLGRLIRKCYIREDDFGALWMSPLFAYRGQEPELKVIH